jgi:dihydroflavonol-4-reductase
MEQHHMRALAGVTGVTGLLGANVAKALLEAGHRVRATRRRSSQADHLRELDLEWVEAELHDRAALARAFTGCDVVFHLAALVSVRRAATPELVATNVTGTENVLAAVAEANVPRLVHCSTVGAVGLSDDGRPCTEDSRWNLPERGMVDGYVETKHRAEQRVRDAVARGLDAVTANPTYMFGPYDARPSSGKMIVEVVRGKVPGFPSGRNNFVDVRDVARGMLLVWQKGRRGERYILGGENLSYKEAFERIATVAGVPAPRRSLPRAAARAFGWFGDLGERFSGREPLINSVSVGWGFCGDFIFSSEKAMRELGYSAGPIEPAIRDAIAWFRRQGMLR